MSDTKVSKRLARLEKAVERAEKKRKKLKRRVEELELILEDLTEDDEEDDEDDEDDEVEQPPVVEPVISSARHLSEPDATWTVARLREAASSRGMTGVSRMSKTALLSALTAHGE